MSTSTMQDADWITAHEAAEILGLSHGRVCSFLREGRLTGRKLGDRVWMLRREDVEAFAEMDRLPGNPNFRNND